MARILLKAFNVLVITVTLNLILFAVLSFFAVVPLAVVAIVFCMTYGFIYLMATDDEIL